MKSYWMYILASGKHGTLYIGVTNDIIRRIYEHNNNLFKGFATKYNVNKLVYSEEFDSVNDAIYREKCIKKWNREWKLSLIEEHNPEWQDLYENVL